MELMVWIYYKNQRTNSKVDWIFFEENSDYEL